MHDATMKAKDLEKYISINNINQILIMFLILSKNYFVSFIFVSLRANSEIPNKN